MKKNTLNPPPKKKKINKFEGVEMNRLNDLVIARVAYNSILLKKVSQ